MLSASTNKPKVPKRVRVVVEKPPGSTSSANAEKPKTTYTLEHLSEEDKLKVSRLVEKVLRLGQEHDLALQALQEERLRHEEEMEKLSASMNGQLSIIEDQLRIKDEMISSLQTKEAMLTAMLALYQAKMKNLVDLVKMTSTSEQQAQAKQKDLQKAMDHFAMVVDNQRKVIEALESTKTEQSRSLNLLQNQLEQAKRELVLERETRQAVEAVSQRQQLQQQQYQQQQSQQQQSQQRMISQQQGQQQQLVERQGQGQGQEEEVKAERKDDYTHYSLMFNSSMEDEEDGRRVRHDSNSSTPLSTPRRAQKAVVDYSPSSHRPPAPPAASTSSSINSTDQSLLSAVSTHEESALWEGNSSPHRPAQTSSARGIAMTSPEEEPVSTTRYSMVALLGPANSHPSTQISRKSLPLPPPPLPFPNTLDEPSYEMSPTPVPVVRSERKTVVRIRQKRSTKAALPSSTSEDLLDLVGVDTDHTQQSSSQEKKSRRVTEDERSHRKEKRKEKEKEKEAESREAMRESNKDQRDNRESKEKDRDRDRERSKRKETRTRPRPVQYDDSLFDLVVELNGNRS
eukprot:gene2522-2763_t